MRQILISTLLFWSTLSNAQILVNGVYKGKKLPFEICYLTCTDSIYAVEYFFQKGGQIFGHIPVKNFESGFGRHPSKPVLKLNDDSILVYSKSSSRRELSS